MSLLARTRLVAALIAVLTLLLMGTFYVAHERMVAAQTAMDQLVDIWTEVAQLRTATYDYALQGGERPRVQVEAKIRRLHVLFSDEWLAAAISDRADEERRLRHEIHATLVDVEEQMVRMAALSPAPALEERNHRTRSLFNLQGQALAANIATLSVILRAAVDRSHAWVDVATFTLGGLLVVLTLGALMLLERQILRPLDQLRRAAAAIREGKAEGDIATLLVIRRNDEIGELSKTLASMVTRLEVANKDLEGFSYSISHDLRAPLRAIDGFIAILQEDYAAQLDAEGQRLFGIVSDNARKMGQLIDDILALSRAGRLELVHAPVNMNALVDEVWESLVAQQGQRVIEFSRADLPTISGDARALRQVWQNLLDNALKFSRGRAPARIAVSAHTADDLLWYAVKDNGAGFNSDYAGKLFGLFSRLHGMDEFEGTGVGLAIVKRFVQKHGGQVAAEGVVGGGATFRFGLPVNPAVAASTAKE
jgi:signal transduction histidine kinase